MTDKGTRARVCRVRKRLRAIRRDVKKALCASDLPYTLRLGIVAVTVAAHLEQDFTEDDPPPC